MKKILTLLIIVLLTGGAYFLLHMGESKHEIISSTEVITKAENAKPNKNVGSNSDNKEKVVVRNMKEGIKNIGKHENVVPREPMLSREENNKKVINQEKKIVNKVEWPLIPLDTEILEFIPKKYQKLISLSPTPVLVPNEKSLVMSSVVIVNKSGNAVSMSSDDGLIISITSSRISFNYPKLEKDFQDSGGRNLLIAKNEGIWDINWQQFGIVYNITFECVNTLDSRCKDEKYIRSMINGLVFIGGKKQ